MVKIKHVTVPNPTSQVQSERTGTEGGLKIAGGAYDVNADSREAMPTHSRNGFISNFFSGAGKLLSLSGQAARGRSSTTTFALQRSSQRGISSASHPMSSATGEAPGRSHAEGVCKPDALNIECQWNFKDNGLQIESAECRRVIFAIFKQDNVILQSKEKPGKQYVATLEGGRCVIKKRHSGILGEAREKFVEHNFTKALEDRLNAVLAKEEVLSEYPMFEKFGRYVDAFHDVLGAIDIPNDKVIEFSSKLLEMRELHANISSKFHGALELDGLQGLSVKANLANLLKRIEDSKSFISGCILCAADTGCTLFKKDATLSRSGAILFKGVMDLAKNNSSREFEMAREALLKLAKNEKVISKINEIDYLKAEMEHGYEAAKGWIDESLKLKEGRLQPAHETSPLNKLPKRTIGNVFLAAHALGVVMDLLEWGQGFEYRAMMHVKKFPASRKIEKLNMLVEFVQTSSLSGKRVDEYKGELIGAVNECIYFFKESSLISSGNRTKALEGLIDWMGKFKYGVVSE